MLCVHTPTNVLYAMKVVPKAKITTQKQTSQILSELKILKLEMCTLAVVYLFVGFSSVTVIAGFPYTSSPGKHYCVAVYTTV